MPMSDARWTKDAHVPFDAVILCGGLGTRLQSVLGDVPKPMAAVAGRPFLERLLINLQRSSCTHVVLCAGPNPQSMWEYCQDGGRWGLHIEYAKEPERLGTGGGLRCALPHLRTDPVVVLNGDTWCDVDLRTMVWWHSWRGARCTIALTAAPDADRYGSVRRTPEGAITQFAEKRGTGEAGWINAGVYVIAQEVIRSIPSDRPVSLECEIFPQWVGRGLYGYDGVRQFLDIGTPESYRQATLWFPEPVAVSDGGPRGVE